MVRDPTARDPGVHESRGRRAQADVDPARVDRHRRARAPPDGRVGPAALVGYAGPDLDRAVCLKPNGDGAPARRRPPDADGEADAVAGSRPPRPSFGYLVE